MDFEAWVAEVQCVATFVVEPHDWRRYYDADLFPMDAIAQHLADEDDVTP